MGSERHGMTDVSFSRRDARHIWMIRTQPHPTNIPLPMPSPLHCLASRPPGSPPPLLVALPSPLLPHLCPLRRKPRVVWAGVPAGKLKVSGFSATLGRAFLGAPWLMAAGFYESPRESQKETASITLVRLYRSGFALFGFFLHEYWIQRLLPTLTTCIPGGILLMSMRRVYALSNVKVCRPLGSVM